MKSEQNIKYVYDLCMWNKPAMLEQTLKKYKDEPLDIETAKEEQLFEIAIIKNYPEILKVLINYYKEISLTSISSDLKDSDQNYSLSNIIQDIVYMGTELSSEVQELIAPYLLNEENQIIINGENSSINDY